VVVPQKFIESENAKEGDDVRIFISLDKVDLRKMFGKHKFSRSTDEIMREIDEDLYDD